MSDWFYMLGEPLSAQECDQVRQYLRGLGIGDELPVTSVGDWSRAEQTLSHRAWDQRWWDAEQSEQRRLQEKARTKFGEAEFHRLLSSTLESMEAVHGAAAVEAARSGCSDPALIRVAAGAASQALHLAELARLADAGAEHPFAIKAALFAGGHWPLGIVAGCFYVF